MNMVRKPPFLEPKINANSDPNLNPVPVCNHGGLGVVEYSRNIEHSRDIVCETGISSTQLPSRGASLACQHFQVCGCTCVRALTERIVIALVPA